MERKGWLTSLGEYELELTKKYGFDHPKTEAVRRKFAEAYKQVQAIRQAYNNPNAT